MAPGKRTRGRGKSGSSTTSSDLGGLVKWRSGKEEAEQRRPLGFRRRWRRRDGLSRGLGFKEGERVLLGFKVGLWLREEGGD